MLGSIRKFSTTIYAKILLGIVIIPFVFWGMGNVFTSGNKNIVVVIDKEKYTIQEFTNFIRQNTPPDQKVKSGDIEKLLSNFIGEKLIKNEVDNFEIQLSNSSLSKIIKNQQAFKKENKFSRTKYEKFLVTNNVTAVTFELNLSNKEKKTQLLNFVAGGIMPANFMVNQTFNKLNQKRKIEFINLNELFENKLNFSEDQVSAHFEKNKNNYKEIFKSIKLIELEPIKLLGNNEFNDAFFKKIDEIDNYIIEGKNLDFIVKKLNLEKPNSFTFNKAGENLKSQNINELTSSLKNKIFDLNEVEPTTLVEDQNKYFIVKIVKVEDVQRTMDNSSVKKRVLLDLTKITKRKYITELIAKINKEDFNKSDFEQLSKNENLSIKKATLENQEDNKTFKKEVVKHIYRYPKDRVVMVNDTEFIENYLVYIDKIINVTIDEDSENYKKYNSLTKLKMTTDLFNTYDSYVKNKYKIDINYQALNSVKNFYN